MTSISQLLEKNPEHAAILKAAGILGAKLGIRVFVVGGYVRDALLGRSNKDLDLMVEGDGVFFAQQFSKVLKCESVVVFEKFGTAMIPHSEIEIEVATARTEEYDSNSRKPRIKPDTVETDMSRRDFTINAMAASILPTDFGRLIDPFNGIQAMKNGIIKTPLDPDVTFSDDPLRMLRATRFAAQLKFGIAPESLASIKRQKDRLKIVSRERITEEIRKTLQAETPSIGFSLNKKLGLLAYIFPELDLMSGVENVNKPVRGQAPNKQGHKDIFLHTLQVVDNTAELTTKIDIRFAALVHDIAKPQTKKFVDGIGWTFHGHEEIGRRMMFKIAKRMKLGNELRDYLMLLIKLHLRPIALAKEGVTDSAVRRLMFEAGDVIDDLMVLCRADITTQNPKKVKKYLSNFDHVEELMQDVKLRDQMKKFQSPVRGDVIMRDLNLKPGQIIGKIKKAIEDAILDGQIPDEYDSAYEYMMKIKDEYITKNNV